jgi:hypothetical protein
MARELDAAVDEALAMWKREPGRDPPALTLLVRDDEEDVGTPCHGRLSLGR